jgi:hypothetical protein
MPDQARVSAEAVAGQPAELLGHPFQAARSAAQACSAFPVALAEQALALPSGEPVARGAAGEAVLPRAAGHAAVAPQAALDAAAEEEARDAAAAPLQAVEASVGTAVPRPEAAGRDGVVRPREVRDAEALPRAAPDVQAALPSAVAWAFRQDQALPSAQPVPQPAARSVHATEHLRIAPPSARSWQAAKDEVWTYGVGSRKSLATRSGDLRISVRPDCGGHQRRLVFISEAAKA